MYLYLDSIGFCFRMAGSDVNCCCVTNIATNDIRLSTKIDSYDSCDWWSSHCFGMFIYVLRHAIPSTVRELRYGNW